jgi:hypothetical protein
MFLPRYSEDRQGNEKPLVNKKKEGLKMENFLGCLIISLYSLGVLISFYLKQGYYL